MRYKLLILFVFFSSAIQANIGVSPIVVDLMDKEVDAEIAVKNFDTKRNAYVEIAAYRFLHPENSASSKIRVRHPEKDGLVVFPAKLILLPGQTQFVRVVKTVNNLSRDQVYQVEFIPKVATQYISQKADNGANLGIRVIVGYGARITLRPDKPSPLLVIKRINNELIIKNKGNTSLSITSCKERNLKNAAEIALPAYTIFAGQTVKAKLPQSKPVVLEVACMNKSIGKFHSD